jgi:hypothetical protein
MRDQTDNFQIIPINTKGISLEVHPLITKVVLGPMIEVSAKDEETRPDHIEVEVLTTAISGPIRTISETTIVTGLSLVVEELE